MKVSASCRILPVSRSNPQGTQVNGRLEFVRRPGADSLGGGAESERPAGEVTRRVDGAQLHEPADQRFTHAENVAGVGEGPAVASSPPALSDLFNTMSVEIIQYL